MPVEDDDVTDVDQYLANNPEFAKCRRGHKFPEDDEVDIVETYRDNAATHHRVKVCPRCNVVRRERFRIVVRRGRVVSFTELDPRMDYKEAKGYVAKGVRINRRYVKEVSIRRALEAQLAANSSATAARRVREPSTRARKPARRKAVA